MKLSKETLAILRNYSAVNPSIFIPKGSMVSTMSNDKNIISYADVDEDFPTDIALYDLNEVLSLLDLFDDPDVEFGEKTVTISGNGSVCEYAYAEKDIITYPKNKLNFPTVDVSFQISKEQMDKLLKASNTLGLPVFCITKDDTDIVMKVVDPKNPSSNTFSCVVGNDDSEKEYEFFIKQEYFKMVKDDYTVSLSSKFISRFESSEGIEYYVAMEKSSTYSE